MSTIQIQKGERGRWPKKKPEGRGQKPEAGQRVSRREAIKKAAAAAAAVRFAGFVAWSDPDHDLRINLSDEQE